MTRRKEVVDWYAYAQQYDLLLAYNPYYQEAMQRIMQEVMQWDIRPGGIIADLGAGSGNYSVKMAQLLQHTTVIHLENNRGMNALAAKKAAALPNFRLLNKSIEEADFSLASLDGVLCINALYTFPEPHKVLEKVYQWLRPGAPLMLLDPGRVMNLRAWKWAIARHLVYTYGLRQAWRIFQQGKAVSAQNAHIREQQRQGHYWTHTHEDFCATIREAGFIVRASDTYFRGECDLVMAQKPV